jgi:hypothetical protein
MVEADSPPASLPSRAARASSKAFNTEHTTCWQPASTIMSTIPLWPMVAEAA